MRVLLKCSHMTTLKFNDQNKNKKIFFLRFYLRPIELKIQYHRSVCVFLSTLHFLFGKARTKKINWSQRIDRNAMGTHILMDVRIV